VPIEKFTLVQASKEGGDLFRERALPSVIRPRL
jgi:hypothetical protein